MNRKIFDNRDVSLTVQIFCNMEREATENYSNKISDLGSDASFPETTVLHLCFTINVMFVDYLQVPCLVVRIAAWVFCFQLAA
jgi:hypothetical protein